MSGPNDHLKDQEKRGFAAAALWASFPRKLIPSASLDIPSSSFMRQFDQVGDSRDAKGFGVLCRRGRIAVNKIKRAPDTGAATFCAATSAALRREAARLRYAEAELQLNSALESDTTPHRIEHDAVQLHEAGQRGDGRRARACAKAVAERTGTYRPFIGLRGNDLRGSTTLIVATKLNLEAALLALLEGGADVTIGDQNHGTTALHYAVNAGREALVQVLLASRPDLEARDHDGMTALHCAASRGLDAILKLLIGAGANVGAASTKRIYGWESLWTGHMMLGYEKGPPDMNLGSSVLHYAAMNGHVSTMLVLGGGGADVAAVNNLGQTAMHAAVAYGRRTIFNHAMILGMLMSMGSIQDDDLVQFAGIGGDEWVRILIAIGGDVTARNQYGWTALHYVAESGCEAAVKLLLEHGADASAVNKALKSASFYAIQNGHRKCAVLLEQAVWNASTSKGIPLLCGDVATPGSQRLQLGRTETDTRTRSRAGRPSGRVELQTVPSCDAIVAALTHLVHVLKILGLGSFTQQANRARPEQNRGFANAAVETGGLAVLWPATTSQRRETHPCKRPQPQGRGGRRHWSAKAATYMGRQAQDARNQVGEEQSGAFWRSAATYSMVKGGGGLRDSTISVPRKAGGILRPTMLIDTPTLSFPPVSTAASASSPATTPASSQPPAIAVAAMAATSGMSRIS